ncbi:protein LEKR1 [Centropristis striata]|uniref:protein LEKR1 n=1 Tax=Centropristis striata TaxID=184440 RepID=UPI0027DEC963|nr:protein LEKR1 [Centropristis striata]
MGDEERSMEAEKEGETEMKIVLHCPPIYPLPEEIKKMEHSETVCRYCGVSYLIYHEFHQLHTRLVQMEEELQELRETIQREKAQREALELGRLEWERAVHLEALRQAEEKEKTVREDIEERNKDTERALKDEYEKKIEKMRQEIKDEYQKISKEKERQVRRELGDLEAETLRKQREELERRAEGREKVLSDALQKANKNLDELRKYFQQLKERLAVAASMKEEAEKLLGKEKQQNEIHRGVCVQQQQALRATLSVLRSSGSELTDVQGFLSQLLRAWQAFKSQILQHTTQVFSVLTEELKHSRVELQKTREEKERLTQQVIEQRRLSEEQLSQQKDSENEHREKLLRLKEELEEKNKMWLSCRERCDAIQEQLLSWRQKEGQMSRKYCAAEEEVTRLGESLKKAQQETRELRREREILIESHTRSLTKMEKGYKEQMSSKLAVALEEQRTQNALHLREQMEELRRDLELELTIDREKNRLLLLQYQQDSTQLQQKVALLQETVRRECEEREGLTAALSQAQDELIGLQSLVSHQGSSRSLHPMERHTPPGNNHFHLHSQSRVPLARSLNSPNTLRPSPSCTDKDRARGTDGGGAGRSFESWNRGREKRREGTLPRLSEVQHKVSLGIERKKSL